MIVSSKVDLVCWTGRVGLVCRDCREALTTGDAGGARRISKRAAIEGATGTPSLQRFTPTTGAGPFNDRCGSVTFSERCDFRCGSFATVWSVASHFRSSPNIGPNQIASACLKTARTGHGEVKRSPCGFSAISPSVITHLSLLPCQPNRERLTIFIKKARALVIQTRRRQGRTTSC